MPGIDIKITGGEDVARELRDKASRLRARLREALIGEGESLARYIAATKLSGQLVNVRTGRLRRGMTSKLVKGAADGGPLVVAVFDQASKTVAGRPQRYAFYLAAGAKGIPQVRAHLRRVPQRDVYRYMPTRQGKTRTSIKRMRVAEWKVPVKAHRRAVDFQGRPIFDQAYEERKDAIQARIRNAIDSLVAERGGLSEGGGI